MLPRLARTESLSLFAKQPFDLKRPLEKLGGHLSSFTKSHFLATSSRQYGVETTLTAEDRVLASRLQRTTATQQFELSDARTVSSGDELWERLGLRPL